jgi:nitrate reductase gamma subunit
MTILYPFILVLILGALGYVGGSVQGLRPLFGIFVPYAAILVFLAGVVRRVIRWSNSPVPFRITATCGQQKSLPWIKPNRIDNPSTGLGVFTRMAFEILLFRSLFRNTKANLHGGPRLVCAESKFLWLGALAFHWSFLIVLLRHLRFLLDPVPKWVLSIQNLDGFFQIGAPVVYATDLGIFAALIYLLSRRVFDLKIRYISLVADYFALFLLLGVALSGFWMRYFFKTDIMQVKQLALGLAEFSPVIPEGLGPVLFIHIFLLSALVAYFPFSKLMHMGGVFLSPTRNLANNNRSKRHVNPWDYPVRVHSYEEWEEEFRDKIVASGLPLEKGTGND